MASLRLLMVLLLIGGTASAKRRPPDPDLFELDREPEVEPPRIRRPPPAPTDEATVLLRQVKLAMVRSRAAVQACAERSGSAVDSVQVRIVIGVRRVDVFVPARGPRQLQRCVRNIVQRAVRGMVFTQRRPPLTTSHTFLIDRSAEDGFAQPPPRDG